MQEPTTTIEASLTGAGSIEPMKTTRTPLSPLEIMQKLFALAAMADGRRRAYARTSKHAQARTLRAVARQKKARDKR